jgi:hypothetical protein
MIKLNAGAITLTRLSLPVSGIIFLKLLLAISGCSLSIEPPEIYGTYVADYDFAKEKLTLSRDGTFIQEITVKVTSKVDVARGTWTYDPKTGYGTFHENFMIVMDGFKRPQPDYTHPRPGLVVQPVEKFFGRIRIGSDEGILYKKIDVKS